jgi:eukaryotic-like serine/threonine-protein kinase
MEAPQIVRDAILEQLERVLSSDSFRRAERPSALLRYLVEQTLAGQSDRLKEYSIGVEALGRGDSFDPRTDPIVRADASRLRARLERYYASEGTVDTLIFVLPKGSYIVQFTNRSSSNAQPDPDANGLAHLPNEKSSNQRWSSWLAAGVLVSGLGIAIVSWTRAPSSGDASQPVQQFEVELKSDGTLGSEVGADMALSPDGMRLVFVTHDAGGHAYLNARRLDQPNIVRLPGTDGARGPFLSPDGKWAGFWADSKLKKIAVEGGSPVVLCDATDLLGASWGEDDNIIAALNFTGKLWRIPAAGGEPVALPDSSPHAAGSTASVWPQVLPGGQRLIFTRLNTGGADRSAIELRSIASGESTVLVRGGTYGRYLPNGFLTYINQGTLYAVPFDAKRSKVTGQAVPVLESIRYAPTFGYAQMDLSKTGTLVYRKGVENGRFVIQWLDRSGKTQMLLGKPGRYVWPCLSPDGTKLAYSSVESGAFNIWLYDLKHDTRVRLGSSVANPSLLWSPDGRALFLGGADGIAWIRADSLGDHSEAPRPLTGRGRIQIPWSFSPDGKRLAYHEMNPSTGFDLWTVAVEPDGEGFKVGEPEVFLRTPAFEVYPSFSPDGRWMAYASNESGTWEVYVRAFPDNGTKVRVSNLGGRVSRWSPNGRELFYATDDQRIFVAGYRVEAGRFVPNTPHAWSTQSLGDTGVLSNFDLSSDGQRVAALVPAVRPEDQQSLNHVTFMLNFADDVRGRVSREGHLKH